VNEEDCYAQGGKNWWRKISSPDHDNLWTSCLINASKTSKTHKPKSNHYIIFTWEINAAEIFLVAESNHVRTYKCLLSLQRSPRRENGYACFSALLYIPANKHIKPWCLRVVWTCVCVFFQMATSFLKFHPFFKKKNNINLLTRIKKTKYVLVNINNDAFNHIAMSPWIKGQRCFSPGNMQEH
jgi:hypothetical protein